MQDNTHFRLMAQAVGDQAKLRRLKEQEETKSEPEPNTDEIRPPIYGLMAALAEISEQLNKTNEHLERIRENTYNASDICSYLSEIRDKLPNK